MNPYGVYPIALTHFSGNLVDMAEDKPQGNILFNGLSEAVFALGREIRELSKQKREEFEWAKQHLGLATKRDLDRMEERLMTKIEEFAEAQNSYNARIDAAVEGLSADIKALNDKITELQNNPGAISPSDQKLLDDIQLRSESIATKLEVLDALQETPPVPPAA